MSRETRIMLGWVHADRVPETGRPCGIHPTAEISGPPEYRTRYMLGDPYLQAEIHPHALINAFCTVDGGMPDMQTTTIGARTFLMAHVHVGHNAIIGEDCEIGVGAMIGGEVIIGNGVRVAGQTWLKPRVRIGEGAIIGGGAVVTKDVPAHEVWAGNPARFMKLAWTHPDYVNEQQARSGEAVSLRGS